MICYSPLDGDPRLVPLRYRPRTCFLMTQLGAPVPPVVGEIRTALKEVLREQSFTLIDADSAVTGRDFLLKIWELIIAVPVGIAVVHEEMRPTTIANIFYEMGLMQAYGKETLVVKTPGTAIPSDFVRTEYVEYGDDFKPRMRRFFASLRERATYYATAAEQVDRNPLLAIDFLRRAYLLTSESGLRGRAREVFDEARIRGRASNSVESLLVSF